MTTTNVNTNNSNSTSSRVGPGGNSSGSKACAACKYQRRRCAPNCPLAIYFPPDKQQQFLNAHRLFGVSNIIKVLKNLQPSERKMAIESMIYQADVRAADPVGGCARIIVELQRQIERGKAELDLVRRQLAICSRAQEMQNSNMAASKVHGKSAVAGDPMITTTMHQSNCNYHQPSIHIESLQCQDQNQYIQDNFCVDVDGDIKPLLVPNEPNFK